MPKHKIKLKSPEFRNVPAPAPEILPPAGPVENVKRTICLNMIVKNESKIITRCLNSAKPIISYVSIVDTGSTDNTIEIIKKWCADNKIEGTVHQEPFKNFGYNRTHSAEMARKTYPQATYLLLLDADMILEINPSFSIDSLTKDQYALIQHDNWMEYWNPRLLKVGRDWKCLGVTHEYWDNSGGTTGRLESLRIHDINDGGAKSDKYTRDKRLLLEGINDKTTPPGLRVRYFFYLANTLKNLSDWDESISWYKKRVDAGGWVEEIFFSLLYIGDCYVEKKDLISAEYYYREAWERHPTRAESIYKLCKLFREQKRNNSALLYALQAKKIPYPREDSLFIDTKVYDYLIDFEISICGYYVPQSRELAKEAQARLMKSLDKLPKDIASKVKDNDKFFT